MKNICLLINFLYSFICIICQDVISIPQYLELQQIQFLENERYHLEENDLAIPFKNKEDLQRIFLNFSTQQLIEKQKEIDLGLDDNARLFKFLSHQGKYIDICVLQNQTIDCKIRINNTLYNEGIIVNQITSNSIYLPSNSCQSAFYIEENSFLIHCLSSNNQIQYFLLNNLSQILDEITIDQPHNCRLDSKFQRNKLFINSLDCQISIILIIEINLQVGILQFNKNFTKLHESDIYPNHSNLIDLKVCEQDVVLLIYTNFICNYNLENQKFTIVETSYQPWFIYIQDSCFPYVIRGQFQAQSSVQFYYPIFNSMINQIKSIQQSKRIFIFLYQDYAVVTHDNFYKEIVLNIKQIYNLNTLPFLLTLDQDNKISLYQIICLNKFIQYSELPFIGIYQKGQLRYSQNQILFYHQISQYILNYPLKIELTESIHIKNNKRVTNTFITYFNILSQSIPFYLDLEFDQDHVLQYYKSEIIVTHHRNLLIKKILKIISFDFNFIIIIYEDLYHKIYANLKNDIYKNIYIMSTTFEVSVEYLQEDINQINLYFITKNQIIQFKILNQNDIVFYNSIKLKIDIQQYKIDQLNIICLFNDNTVLAYQYNYWYEYFQVNQKYKRELLMKKDNKYNDFRVPYLYIDHQNSTIEIKSIIPYQKNILVTANGEILLSHIFVPYFRILLIVKNDNLIQLKLYFFDLNEILLLYQIPTFEFLILEPIEIKFYEKLFSIITTKNEQKYLFTYNVTQQGKSCLRQITKMSLNYQSFDLIDVTGITSQILTDKIIINYPYLNFSIESTKITDYSRIDYQIKFQAKSFIQSIPSQFIINLHLFNFKNNLRYKFNTIQQMLMINNYNEISNVDSIFGSINNLYLSQTCKGYLNKPIQLIKSIQLNNCSIIYKQICLVSQSIMIIDYFYLNITITLPQDTILLNTMIKSNYNLIILYNHKIEQIGIFSISENQLIQQNINNDSYYIKLENFQFNEKYKSINLINDFLMIETFQFYSIYSKIRDQNNLKYEQECFIDLQQVKQIQFLFNYEYSYIFLMLKFQSQLCFYIGPQSNNEIMEQQKYYFDFQIAAFHILNSKYENQQIHLIIILFCPTDIGYIFEFNFDLQQQMITKTLMKSQIIRYINITYLDFKKISDTNFILKGKYENESFYLYKINLNSSIEVIDYYYKDEEFSDIEYYNETHFVQINNNVVQLIEIHNYQLHLQNNNCELVLYNDVSSLRTTIFMENTINNKYTITLYLLMGNLLLILHISNKKRRV